MDPEYERETLAIEDRHWWYVSRRRLLSVIVESLELEPGSDILDAGCGSGRNLEWLGRFGPTIGLELSAAGLAIAERRGLGTVVKGSVEAIPLPDRSVDLAVCLDVLEHVDDRLGLSELHRVVRPGGNLLVTVPAYAWLWGQHDVQNQHLRRYTRTTLFAAASQTGWAPRWSSYFNSLLFVPAAAYRLLAEYADRKWRRRPASDFQATPGLLNPVLRVPGVIEAAFVRRGGRLPLGLSLVAVLSKR